MFKRLMVLMFTVLISCFLVGCEESPTETDDGPGTPGPGPRPVYGHAYDAPSWSPDGSMIVFSYQHITAMDSADGGYYFDPDSSGIWAINPDGSNRRMLLQGVFMGGGSPKISPDGEWLAFAYGGHIYKARLQNGQVDESQIFQLTSEGRNFFPDWSPDGEWIAYDNTNCGTAVEPSPPNQCGVMLMDKNGQTHDNVLGGRTPDWLPDNQRLIYIGFHSEIYIGDVNDSTVFQVTHLNEEDTYATTNRYPDYCSVTGKIVFSSHRAPETQVPIGSNPTQVWVMDSDGANQRQLTEDGAQKAAWSPDGQSIVYLRFNRLKFNPQNGTLWVMDADGGNKRQLTFNTFPIITSATQMLPKHGDRYVAPSKESEFQ